MATRNFNVKNGLTAGNIILDASNSNITANYYFGNGSQLTGITASQITGVSSIANGNSNVNIPAANGNVNISAVGNANVVVVTGTGANVAGTLTATGNANVGNLGTARVIATGNISGTQLISNIATGTAPLVVTSTTVVTNLNADLLDGLNSATAATASTIAARDANGNISANFFIGNGSQLTGITASQITGVSSISNGTSNVNIPASGGNVNTSVGGTANVLVVTATGVNVAGTLNATGNANTGNIGTAQVLASANVTAPQFISNVAQGTAPLVVTSTTVVSNLNADFLDGAHSASAATASTIALRDANGNISANFFIGNGSQLTGITASQITGVTSISNGTSNVNIPASGGNVNTSVGSVANVQVVTSTGVNVAGTMNATGNVTGGNLVTSGVLNSSGTAQSNIAGNLSMGTKNIISLADPVNAQDAATKNYVDTVAQGLDTKASVVVATAAALPTYTYNNGTAGVGATLTGSATGALSIDSVAVTATSRVLVKNETAGNAPYNGIYTVTNTGNATAAYVLTRSTDMNTWSEVPGAFVFVETGTVNSDTGWVSTADASGTMGTTAITWTQFSGAGSYTAGTGLTLTGGQFSVNASQTQITNVGLLANLTVGNATANTQFGNGTITANGNITANFFIGNGSQLTGITASQITGVSSISNGTSNVNIPASGGNVNTSVGGTANVLVVTGTGVNVAGTLNATGNANTGNLGTAQVLATANVTAPQLISNVATGTAPFVVTSTTKVANLNVEQVDGFDASQSATANTLAVRDTNGNLTANFYIGNGSQLTGISATATSGIANGTSNILIPASGGNVNTSVGGTANVLVVTGTGANVAGTLNATGNANVGNLGATGVTATTLTGSLTTVAQPNITSVGTLTGLTANGNANINLAAGNSVTITATAPPTADMLVITNAGQNVATAGVSAMQVNYIGGAGAIEASAIRSDMTPGSTSGSTWNAFRVAATAAAASGVTFNGMKFDNKTAGAGTSRAFYVGTGYDEILNYNGTILIYGNGIINGGQLGNLATANSVVIGNGASPVTSVAPGTNGNVLTSNGTNWVSTAPTSGTSASIANGTSNVNIPTSGGNVNTSVGGTANVLVVTATGANITGTFNVSGNANVGNLGTAGQIVSSIATGTAPFTVASTTKVSNLNVELVDGFHADQTNTANTIVVRDTNGNIAVGNITSTGNLVTGGGSGGNISGVNVLTATTLIGTFANGNSDISIPDANGNILFDIAGTSNVVVMTSTGVNVAGTLNATGNANVGNIGTATAILTTAANTPLVQNGTSNVAIASGANVTLGVAGTARITATSAGGNVNGTFGVSGNANVGNLGAATAVLTTAANTPLVQNGTSNVAIASGANVTLGVAGTARITATSAGGNVNGTLTISTAANVPLVQNGTSNVAIASGANVTLGVAGTTRITATSTGANVTGTLGVSGILTGSANVSGTNVISSAYQISSVNAAVSAAGTTQGTGTVLATQFNVVSTVASGAGVVLPVAVAGMRITVLNTSANALLVYPATNGIINSQAANAAYSQPAGARLDYISTTTTQWYTLNATYG